MARKTTAILGLGQFGMSLVEELLASGQDVIAIDKDENKVKRLGKVLSTAFVANSTDEIALKELKVKDADAAIVTYGSDIESSILTTVLLKELGIKRIIVRVDDDHYVNIIKKLGADEIIQPLITAGADLASRLYIKDLKDLYALDDKYSIVLMDVNPKFEAKKISALNSKNLYGVNIVLIIRNGTSIVPGGNDSVMPGDSIYVVGTQKEIDAFKLSINGKH